MLLAYCCQCGNSDALLQGIVLLPYVCLCQTQLTSRSSGVLPKRIHGSGWFSAWRHLSTCPTLYCKKIRVSPETKVTGTSLRPTLDWNKIATARRSSAYRQRWTLSTINWTVVNWLKYFILATVYGVYHTDRPLRRRKAARRAGSSATADNCTINSLYFVCLWLATGSCDMPTLCALMG